MKTKHCIAFAALAVAALSGCAGQKEAKVSTGINLANLDTTAVPGNDFKGKSGWKPGTENRRLV